MHRFATKTGTRAFSAASIYVKGLTEEEHTVFPRKGGSGSPTQVVI